MDAELLRINDICWGYRLGRVIEIGCRIGLFGTLSGAERNLEEISARCKTKTDLTEKLLIACCAMGFVERKAETFINTNLAEKYLVPGKELYQGDIILHSANVRENWDRFADEIFLEPHAKEDESARQWHFIRGMDNIASSGRLDVFLSSVDLGGKKNMLDVGGGPGSYSIAACTKYQQLKATVWDLRETISIAKEYISRAGMQERVSVQEGNWDADGFGEGYDVVLMSNILHGTAWNSQMKLKKAFDAMVDGGTLVVQEFLLNDAKTGPVVPSLFNIMVGAYSESELLSVIEEAGFSNTKITGENEDIGSWWVTAVK